MYYILPYIISAQSISGIHLENKDAICVKKLSLTFEYCNFLTAVFKVLSRKFNQ